MNWLDSQNVSVYFKRSRSGFYYAIECMEEILAANYLSKHGISMNSYKDDDLGTCNEIVDDILSIGDSAVCFYVNSENLYLTTVITNLLKQEEENIKIIWHGEIPLSILEELKNVAFEAYVYDNYENNLLYLIQKDIEEWTILSGVYINWKDVRSGEPLVLDRVPLTSIATVYTDGMIAYQEADNMGLPLGRKLENSYEFCEEMLLINEFTTICRENTHIQSIKLLINDLLAYPNWKGFLSSLHKENPLCKFKISIRSNSLNDKKVKELINLQVNDLTIYISDKKDINGLKSSIKSLDYYVNQINNLILSLYVEDTVLDEGNEVIDIIAEFVHKKILKCGSFSIKLSHKNNTTLKDFGKFYLEGKNKPLAKILLDLNRIESVEFNGAYGYEVPLFNGFNAMMTGNYPRITNSAVKHIVIRKEDFCYDLFENLKDFTSINSGLYILYKDNLDKPLPPDGTRLYIEEECNAVKYENNEFSKYYDEALQRNYFLSHLNFFVDNNQNASDRIIFNNYQREELIEMKRISYGEIDNIQPQRSSAFIKYLDIDSMEALDKLLMEADYFVKTGRIDKSSLINHQLINYCRWGNNGTCHVTNIPRLKIDKENNIYPCFDCEESLGTIGQYQYEVVKNSYEKIEREFIERKCGDCPVHNKCTKCVMLPSFLNREDYCNIRREHPYISDYLLFLNVYDYLIKNSNYINETNIDKIRIISDFTFCFSKDIPFGNEEDYIFKPSYIVYLKDGSLMWSPVKSRFYKVSDDLVYVVELMLKNLSINQIIEMIQKDYKLEYEEAKSNTQTVYNYLYKAGCIKRQIKIY